MPTTVIRITICFAFCVAALVTGCRHASSSDAVAVDREANAIERLRWVEAANATEDATAELAAARAELRRPKLLALATRSPSYPGLNDDQLKRIRSLADDRTAPGSGDVIFGENHRRLLVRLYKYVREYNQSIYKSLMSSAH
ncbi:MAG: hypothetical protein K0U72_13620 [Gammaproteobacteria bacterium]|nr:hypothetical protein [Gammaproteobacteria bacterium]